MRMNSLMRQLLDTLNISLPDAVAEAAPERLLALVTVQGCVLFADQAEGCRHVSLRDFPDRTGFEHFVNHFHVPYDGTRASLLQLIGRIAGIRKSLAEYAPDRRFLIIVSIAEGECTISFHECRPGEAWLADNLEGYTEEAVAAIGVGRATDC
jgi:hypothetical protein